MQPYDSDTFAARKPFPKIWCDKVTKFARTNEPARTRKQPEAISDST